MVSNKTEIFTKECLVKKNKQEARTEKLSYNNSTEKLTRSFDSRFEWREERISYAEDKPIKTFPLEERKEF